MVSGPFRDPSASLLRRIEELERSNRRLRKRVHRTFVADLSSLASLLGRAIAMMACVIGAFIIGCIALGIVGAIAVGIVALL